MTLMLSKVPGLSWPLKNVRGCLEWDAHPGECVIFINSVGVLFFLVWTHSLNSLRTHLSLSLFLPPFHSVLPKDNTSSLQIIDLFSYLPACRTMHASSP